MRHFAQALSGPDPEVRLKTIAQIRHLDNRTIFTAALIEPLSKTLRQPATCEGAAALLEELGEPALPVFAAMLGSDSQEVRITAALSILRVSSKHSFPQPYRTGLQEYLADVQQQTVAVVLDALTRSRGREYAELARAAQYLPRSERYRAVERLLRDLHEGPERDAAATALGWMSSDGLPALVVAVNAEDVNVREAAIGGLQAYATNESRRQKELQAALPVLRQAEGDRSKKVSLLATRTIASVQRQIAQIQQDDQKEDTAEDGITCLTG